MTWLLLLLATKPCPPPPCDGLDDAACAAKATWVAVGKITKVVHHPQPEPVFKDFAEITFVPSQWEKGSGPKQLTFRVGWCNNMKQAPDDPSGTFRFFGAPGDAQYLDFRPTTVQKR